MNSIRELTQSVQKANFLIREALMQSGLLAGDKMVTDAVRDTKVDLTILVSGELITINWLEASCQSRVTMTYDLSRAGDKKDGS